MGKRCDRPGGSASGALPRARHHPDRVVGVEREEVAVRRYGEVVEVRTSAAGARGEGLALSPTQFLWRGRLYLVREVLAHWIELGTWWSSARRGVPVPSRARLEGAVREGIDTPRSVTLDVGAVEREVWRVEAAPGRSFSPGVFDLVRDVAPRDPGADPESAPLERWRLARALD